MPRVVGLDCPGVVLDCKIAPSRYHEVYYRLRKLGFAWGRITRKISSGRMKTDVVKSPFIFNQKRSVYFL